MVRMQNCVIWMQIDSLFGYIKTDDIYKDIAEDAETRFYTSNYELEFNFIETLLPQEKKSNWIDKR